MDEMNKIPEENIEENKKLQPDLPKKDEAKEEKPVKKATDKKIKLLPIIIGGVCVVIALIIAIILSQGGKGSNNGGNNNANNGGNNAGGSSTSDSNGGQNGGEHGDGHTHSFDSHKVLADATCFAVGKEQSICSCGEKKESDIPRLDHFVENGLCKLCNSASIIIEDVNGLRNIGLNGSYVLVNDIDFGGETWRPIGTEESPFYGHIDGNGHSISNLVIENYFIDVGFIGHNYGVIENLGLKSIDYDVSADNAGGLVGTNFGFVSNCYVEGDISYKNGGNSVDFFVAGLVGYNYGPVVNSHANVNIVAQCYASSPVSAGGLVGFNYQSPILNCYSTGEISINMPSSAYIGGLVGESNKSTISNCFSTVNISAIGYKSCYVGGLIGIGSGGKYTNCYATGNVDATSDMIDSSNSKAGGFAALCGGEIINCFATGNVKASGRTYETNAGGFIGGKNDNIVNSYRASEQTVTIIRNKKNKSDAASTAGTETSRENLLSAEWAESNLWKEDMFCWSFEDGLFIPDYEAIKNKVVEISTPDELLAICEKPLIYTYLLKNNIDLKGKTFTALGSRNNPFAGVFDGNGYAVYNFNLEGAGTETGLFGYNLGVIKNLSLESFVVNVDPYKTNYVYCGALAGINFGKIYDCAVSGEISGNVRIGSLVGHNVGKIKDCKADTIISFGYNYSYVGGIAGDNNGTVINSVADTEIRRLPETRGAEVCAGGIVGENKLGVLINCSATVKFIFATYENETGACAGGIAGINYGEIENCFAEGTFDISNTIYNFVGGIAGRNLDKSEIKNCHSVVDIKAYSYRHPGATYNYAGGIAGENNGRIENCLAEGNVLCGATSPSNHAEIGAGGIVGRSDGVILNSVATGNVTGNSRGGGYSSSYANVGGIFGDTTSYNSSGIAINCYRYMNQVFNVKEYDAIINMPTNGYGEAVDDTMLISSELYIEKLSWSGDIWRIEDGKMPCLKAFSN